VEELERAAALAGREGKTEVKDGKVLIKCHSQVSSQVISWTWRRGKKTRWGRTRTRADE
jgi:hypothetical protein